MNESVKAILKANVWHLATMAETPNVVPVGIHAITEDDRLLLGDVMMATSVDNVRVTGQASVCAWDPKTSEGYQVKGKAEYETSGPDFDMLNEIAIKRTNGAMRLKGVISMTPEMTIVVTPGPDNKMVM